MDGEREKFEELVGQFVMMCGGPLSDSERKIADYFYKAGRASLPAQPSDVVEHPVFAFLLGEGTLDGRGFGDEPPVDMKSRRRIPFWWRKHLREALSTTQQAPEAWEDTPDEYTADIAAAHPMKTGDHDTYQIASKMIRSRHSKGALIELVNWLLTKQQAQNTAPLDGGIRQTLEPSDSDTGASTARVRLPNNCASGALSPEDECVEIMAKAAIERHVKTPRYVRINGQIKRESRLLGHCVLKLRAREC